MFYNKRTQTALRVAMFVFAVSAVIMSISFSEYAWGKWVTGSVCLVGILIASVDFFWRLIFQKKTLLPSAAIGFLAAPLAGVLADSFELPFYWQPVLFIAIDILVITVVWQLQKLFWVRWFSNLLKNIF